MEQSIKTDAFNNTGKNNDNHFNQQKSSKCQFIFFSFNEKRCRTCDLLQPKKLVLSQPRWLILLTSNIILDIIHRHPLLFNISFSSFEHPIPHLTKGGCYVPYVDSMHNYVQHPSTKAYAKLYPFLLFNWYFKMLPLFYLLCTVIYQDNTFSGT